MSDGTSVNRLTSLAKFETSIEPTLDGEFSWSPETYHFSGTYGGQTFSVDFEYGYDRPNGFRANQTVFEPETICIYHMGVSEGHGLGSAVLASLIEHAREKGFHAARMGIINPRVIGVVSKLQRFGIIESSCFRLVQGEDIMPEPATSEMMNGPDVLTAEEASTLFTPLEAELTARKMSGEEIGDESAFVDCAIFF